MLANGRLVDAINRISPDGMFQVATQAILNPHVTAVILTTDQRVAVAPSRARPDSILSLDQSLLVVGPQVLVIVGDHGRSPSGSPTSRSCARRCAPDGWRPGRPGGSSGAAGRRSSSC